MKSRLNYAKKAPGVYESMHSLDSYLVASGLDNILLHLVRLRSSQINGCAYRIDMHWKDLRALGEPEYRLYSLEAWRESPFYSDKERAALSWAEAVTLINETRVPEEVYRDVWPQLSERELCDLTLAIAAINAWNRLSITARLKPGSYKSPFSEVH